MYVWFQPTEGKLIAIPHHERTGDQTHVPPGGMLVRPSDYWRRRVADGGGTLSDHRPGREPGAPAKAKAKGGSK